MVMTLDGLCDRFGKFPAFAQFGCDFGMVKSQNLSFSHKMGIGAVSQKFFERFISAKDLLVKNQFAHIVKKPG